MSSGEDLVIDWSPSDIYFCVFCPDIPPIASKSGLESHLRRTHLNGSSTAAVDEKEAIDLWIGRHMKYQESLNRCMSQSIKTIPDRTKTLYKGCPVCDRIIKYYNIRNEPNPKDADRHELLIRDINVDYTGNNVNHINPHLRYYPYECLICEEESQTQSAADKRSQSDEIEVQKEKVKTAVKAMMRRHIIDKHMKKSPLNRKEFDEKVEESMRTLKVTELEMITKRPITAVKPTVKTMKPKSTPGPLREPQRVVTSPVPPIKRLRPLMVALPISQTTTQTNQPIAAVPIAVGPIAAVQTALTASEASTSKNVPLFVRVLPAADPKTVHIITPMPCTSTPVKPSIPKISDEIISDDEVEISSDEEAFGFEFDSLKAKTYGCVFCCKRYSDYNKAFDHYLRHCFVYLECAKCHLKLKNITDFRSHNALHKDQQNLLKLNEFKGVRKWIERFLRYQSDDRKSLIDMSCDVNRVYCPVCLFVSAVFDIQSTKQLANCETIESHIHNHLQYFPYECIDCNYEDIKTEFCLDAKAKRHLMDKHGVQSVDDISAKELGTYFNSVSIIPKLDEMIAQTVEITNRINDFWTVNSKDKEIQ
ncbi:unnamed protein product [Medioppia subpectinata]|uniref:C2H2-type domain-containing protein n=1 Tax=Medioppia subpectinata TaxID=1979941 RepID=A0A7R9KWK3_9ACAR|nr:unnamed protein product [Medioppia subpectinata]CAG2111071.1 unnamed protein product [Medioppia subpectinata]